MGSVRCRVVLGNVGHPQPETQSEQMRGLEGHAEELFLFRVLKMVLPTGGMRLRAEAIRVSLGRVCTVAGVGREPAWVRGAD